MSITILKRVTLTIAFVLLCTNLKGQVTIAPTNMFLSDSNPFGTYMVINGSSEAQEISVDFLFAYSATDENGNRRIIQDDSTFAENHSIANKVRAFPRNFTLAPDQRQIVRLRLSDTNSLEDGTYWARIRTKSVPETPPIEVQNTTTVSARVGITFEQVTGLFFKKGNVTTGIDIKDIKTEINAENQNELIVLADFDRTGNSPFLGTITMSIRDSNNRELVSDFVSTSHYFGGTHRQTLDISSLTNGNYQLTVEFATKRTDVSEADLVRMQPVRKSISFTKN
ncbi:MAG: hypothetical protein JJ895_01080 [Balneolaceae bacterium]|nr:hypothetical protein [Balneolaceae bacterium]